jgi:hypothetical protein
MGNRHQPCGCCSVQIHITSKITTRISTSVEATNDISVRPKPLRTPYNLRCNFIYEALGIKVAGAPNLA